MSTIRKIAKNTGILIISQSVCNILGFFFIMYTARYLGAEGFGVLSFALAFAGIFTILSDLGMNTLTVREVARDKSLAGKYLGNIAVIKVILVFITYTSLIISINLLEYSEQTKIVVYLIALSIILNSFNGLFYSIYQAFEKMEYQSLGLILNSSLMLIGALLLITQDYGVIAFASLYLFVCLIVMGYNFAVCICKFGNLKLKINLRFWKPVISEALPFGVTGIFVTIYYWIDSVMLSFFQGNEAVGLYNAAYRMMLFLLVVPNIINIVVFPSMSRFHISSKMSLNVISRKYFKFMLAIGIPLGVGTTLLADNFILLIYGAGYSQSIMALQILIWAIVCIFANASFVRLFEATNRQFLITKIAGICMIENIILNVLIIPRFSYIGASITTVITEFTIVILVLIVSYKIGWGIQKREVVKNIFKIAIASLCMGIFIWYFKSINLLILVLLALLLYSGILYVINGIDKEDIQLLKQMTRRE
jgi:O-antigen/teichoic acid export membrane protein